MVAPHLRIATISLNINTNDLNYGAVLHSWAFQQYLLKTGLVEYTEVIDYTTPSLEGFNSRYPALAYLTRGELRSAASSAVKLVPHSSRFRKFKAFIENNINVSPAKYSQLSLENTKLNFDIVICESDVIWAPTFFGDSFPDRTFFLALDSMKSLKRIAYAPSMANAEISHSDAMTIMSLLTFIDAISCRETYGTKVLQNLTNKPVVTVLDPTLLLDPVDYESITSPPLESDPYVLVYFPLRANSQIVQSAKLYAKKNNCKVIEVSTYWWHSITRRTYADAGIEDWLSLIKNATCVFTDSLHATCFSIIFNTDFYSFSRQTGKKTEDLCGRFGLGYRYVNDSQASSLVGCEADKIDWDKVNKKRKQMAADSKEWLETALLIDKNDLHPTI